MSHNVVKLFILVLWVCAALPALPSAAWGSFMLPPPGYRAKDFALIRHQGVYHLFYTRRNISAPTDSTENDLGHAISTDLISWTQLAPVLPTRPLEWDNLHVWAPHVVQSNGVFYMFYTGVTHEPGSFVEHQRIGVATSTDLETWNRLDEPVFSCAEVPWAYCNPLSPVTAFRDPFLLADAQEPGEWWMFYSTSLAGDSTSMITGIGATADLTGQWSNVGSLAVTGDATTFSELNESPHMFDHDGLWYLLWTTNKSQPLVWATSADPVGQLAAWTYRGTLSSMLGFDTSPWFASEHMRDGLVDYFAAASLTAIEVLRIDWTAPPAFKLVQPSSFHVRTMGWSRPAVAEGDTVKLTIHATGWFMQSARIEVLEVDADGSMTKVPNFQIGLPDAIPLNANQTVFTWTARGYADPGDGAVGPELLVRLTDQTAAAPILHVMPATHPQGGSGYIEDTVDGFKLVFVRRSPLGMAFRVDMPSPADARLDLYDVSGRRLATLHNGPLGRGVSVIRLGEAVRGWSPGMYFARLETADGRRTARFVVMP